MLNNSYKNYFSMEQQPRLMDRLSSLSYVVISPSMASSVNVANFVSEKLHWLPDEADTNYKTWKQQMSCLIKSQGLVDYTNPEINFLTRPNIDPEVWEKNDELVKGWILGSIDKKISSSFADDDALNSDLPAATNWKKLEDKFGSTNGENTKASESLKKVEESTPLHDAALNGDWEAAHQILARDPAAATDHWIDGHKKWKLLHIAVGSGENAIGFVTKLLQFMPADHDLVKLTDASNSTALHTAAAVGNKDAAIILIQKNPYLCYSTNAYGLFPIHTAALYAKREVLEYLISQTRAGGTEPESDPYAGSNGQHLLMLLIEAKFFDIALRLTKANPSMLWISSDRRFESLTLLVKEMKALNPRYYFNNRERFFFSKILPSEQNFVSPQPSTNVLSRILRCMTEKCIGIIEPKLLKKMRKFDEDRHYVPQLFKSMCNEIASQEFKDAADIFQEAIFTASELDVREAVEVVVKTFPGAIYSLAKPSGQHIFHKAIENRSINVFNLIYELSDHQRSFFTLYKEDCFENNPLHSAGKLAPTHKLNETSGAALQMQREMQWFMEVEEIVHPFAKEQENSDKKTPKMVFTEEHKELKEKGESWLRDTANSYVLVATLIATVMIAGAITVPGGNKESGFPMFSNEPAFIAFAVSDAISLFSSVTSLLLFLAILTSRYAEEDFLYTLPTKLMFGLASLFLSIISMMASFIITLYLVFGLKKNWVIFPLLLLACSPIASFTLCQYPLLCALGRSTYGHGIFYKKRTQGFY